MRRRLTRGEWLLLGLLAAWSLIPLAAGIVRLIEHGEVLGGTDGIGVVDHFQYLGWIRDAGEQGLIANRYDVAESDGVYLQPMWLLSGLLVAAGLPIQAGLLLWKPVCVLLLFAGTLAYVRRTLEGRGARLAALALALFYVPPAMVLLGRTGIGSPTDDAITYLFGFQVASATFLWGYVQTAVAVGLMPVFLLAVERLLGEADARGGPGGRRALIVASLSGLAVAWVHPWQGMVLIAIAVAVGVWCGPRRTALPLALPLAATAAPLVYFVALSEIDPAWGAGSEGLETSHQWPLLFAALAPLALLAVAGVVRGRGVRELDVQERMLLLWPLATLVVFGLLDRTFFFNVLSGIAIPLAILAVRGARGLPAWAAVAAVLAVTLPGLVNLVHEFRAGTGAGGSPRYLERSEADALEFVDDSSREGPVLTRIYLGQAVPAFTGRNTYVGHPAWTPDLPARVRETEDAVTGLMSAGRTQAVVRRSGAAFVIQDCQARRDLAPKLGPLVRRTHRFGCATVYEVG